MTDEVRDFYDRYPYPRPVEDLDSYRAQWQDPQRRRADFHLYWPSQTFREDYSILIAGCGTSQAAKHALRWPTARITAIDLSATSVRHTEDLKRKYNLTNLHLHQLPIDRRARQRGLECRGHAGRVDRNRSAATAGQILDRGDDVAVARIEHRLHAELRQRRAPPG